MTIYNQTLNTYDRQIASWLIICALVIFGMIMLGGATRLTNSGLSMVEWRPLLGVIPPLSENSWLAVFEKYQQFPEYKKLNQGMTLGEFKVIFMYEYLHRVLGRLIGVIFFFPMIYFTAKKRIKNGLSPKLWCLFFLGGCQGLLGWYMVKSGLVDKPHVSQYRLMAHLGLATAIYGYMLWVICDLLRPVKSVLKEDSGIAYLSIGLVFLIFFMILSGGLVAGTDAGFAFNTWPMMGSDFIPAGIYGMDPYWLAIFEDILTIQFNHRMFAYFILCYSGFVAWRILRNPKRAEIHFRAILLLVALLIQASLGISALLLHVPVVLGVAHQAGAILLLSTAILLAHAFREESVRAIEGRIVGSSFSSLSTQT